MLSRAENVARFFQPRKLILFRLISVYNDGMHGPFEAIVDTPGYSSVLRIENTGPMEYPFRAVIRPYTFGEPNPLRNNDAISRFGADGRFREW